MSAPLVNYEIIELTKHFGAIVSTPGVAEDIVKKCNKQLKRLVDALDSAVDATLAQNAGLITG